MGKLHRWFALASVALLLSLVWLIYVDYERPWRGFQRNYTTAQAALAHLDYVETQREDKRKEREEAEKAIETAKRNRDAADAAKEKAAQELLGIEKQHGKLIDSLRSNQKKERERRIAWQAAQSNLGANDPTTHERRSAYDQATGEVQRVEQQLASAAPRWPELRQQVEAHPSRTLLEQQIKEAVELKDVVSIPFAKRDALLKVTQDEYEKVATAHGPDHPRTKELAARLAEETDEYTQLRLNKDEAEDHLTALRNQLKAVDAEVLAAQKKDDGLMKEVNDAAKRYEQYSDWLVKGVINMPLLDFTAPKGTPAREQVNQLVLPDVRQRLNYLESYTTDRCTTCHVAIDNKLFTQEALAKRLEHAIPAINEKRIQEGKSPLPLPEPPKLKDVKPADMLGKVTNYWPVLDPTLRNQYYQRLLATVNLYLKDAGLKQIELGQPLLAHPDLDLFVNVDSPHPMAKMGCTVCHEGNPQETDFVQAAHTPKSHEEEEEWGEKYYVTAAGVPNIDFHTIQHYWDRMMLPPKYTEASCTKCHTQVADISRFEFEPVGRQINLGRQLFTKVGCANCHMVDVEGIKDARKVGPELTQVAAKLDRDFVEQWVFYPKKFRPSTWMPHLFMQENNRPGSENASDPDPVLRTETEVSAIAHYLFTLSKDWQAIPLPEDLKGDAENGRKLFKTVGCLACHSNLHEYAGQWIPEHLARVEDVPKDKAEYRYKGMTFEQQAQYAIEHFPSELDAALHPEQLQPPPDAENPYVPPVFTRHAPDLSGIGSKVSRPWLFSWLKEPKHYFEQTRMPNLRLTDQEALDLAEYLLTLKQENWSPKAFPQDEKRLKMADDLIFLLLSGQRSARRSRAVMNDEGGELTRMLVDGLTKSMKSEAAARAKIEPLDLQSKKLLYLGSKMVSHYGCYACHKIAGFEDATPPGTELTQWAEKPIGQLDFAFYDTAFEDMRHSKQKHEIFADIYPKSAEDLIFWAHGNEPEEITHTHAAFAYHKLRNPRIWDREKLKSPYDKLKMPNFYFTPGQAEALVTFLLSRKPPRVTEALAVNYENQDVRAGPIASGRLLTRELNCVGCHQIENNVAPMHQYITITQAGEQVFDEVNAPPSLRGEGAKIQHTWLYSFLNNVEMLRPWLKIRMPSFYLTHDESNKLVEYFAALSGEDADELHQRLKTVHEYVEKAQAAGETLLAQGDDGAGEKKGSGPPPGSDWFAQASLAKQAHYLASFAVERRLAKSFDFDPRTSGPQDWLSAYQKVLERVGFLQKLYDVPYPFSEAQRSLVPQERFELGEKMLMELKCLQCHVLGDPSLPGSNPNPSAPNLNLTFRRLRQEWVRQWVQNPAWIQPGTKMPQFFPPAMGPDGHPHPQSAFVTQAADKRAELEALFSSDGGAQIELLLDYLYNAGIRNHTAVAPVDPNAPAPAAATPANVVFEDEDEEGEKKPGEEQPKKEPPKEPMEFDDPD
jgi:cytochrome c551/c552